jgi:hypothetical protein
MPDRPLPGGPVAMLANCSPSGAMKRDRLNSYIGANRDGRSARYIEHMANERDASRAIDQVANTGSQPLDRAMAFCAKYGLHVPIMLAPMAGACPIS